MTVVAAPRLKNILDQRSEHISQMCSESETTQKTAIDLAEETQKKLGDLQAKVSKAEKDLVETLKQNSQRKKDEIYHVSLERTKQEKERIAQMSQQAFDEISSDIDNIVDLALKKVGYTK